MGYTHYWRYADGHAIPPSIWENIVTDSKKLFTAAALQQIMLWRDFDDPGSEPFADSKEIYFNGAADAGHETFSLLPSQGDFSFCKTAYKPYDRVVCAILAVAAAAAPEALTVSSDGDEEDWEPHLAWASEVLGRPIAYPGTADA